jgi:hypothetical protein
MESEGVVDISILSRDVLVYIYSHLKDPNDMWSFMRVNKRFYRAGCLYSGYTNKIEKLRLFCGLEKLPFEFMSDILHNNDKSKSQFSKIKESIKKIIES